MSLPSFAEKSQAVVSESQHFQLQLNSYTLIVFRVIPPTPDLIQTSFSLSLERLRVNGATTVLHSVLQIQAPLCFPCYSLQDWRTKNTSSICDSTPCMPVIIQSEKAYLWHCSAPATTLLQPAQDSRECLDNHGQC